MSYEWQIEDEGLAILESAMSYIKPRADADADEQVTGEYEAWAILDDAHDTIERSYECRFCGQFTGMRNSHCSRNCYRADVEGY